MERALAWILIFSLFVAATASAQSVTRPTFRALEKVQLLMEAEQFSEALVELEALAIKTVKNPYDFALTSQYLAHASVMIGEQSRARSALEAALATESIPDDLRANMNLFYGTILVGDEDYELARDVLAQWFAQAELPTPPQIFSYGYAVYMAGDVEESQSLIARSISESLNAPESWYQLFYRILFDQKKYEAGEEVLKMMLTRAPTNERTWRMLASHYLQLEESRDGLAALMVAYSNELLETDSDLKQIVALWGYIDAPDKGARLLEEWLSAEKLERDAVTLKQLGNLWLMARERKNAMSVLQQAAEMSPDGRTYELLGGIHFEEEEWGEAYTAYSSALRSGDLEEPSRTSLLAGISAYRAGNLDDAKEALEVAAESEEFRPQAESILRGLR
jgi:Tfp pilus assembly protein PilF